MYMFEVYADISQIVFSYRASNGLGKGALPPGPLRVSLVLSLSCAQAAGTVRGTSFPSMRNAQSRNFLL